MTLFGLFMLALILLVVLSLADLLLDTFGLVGALLLLVLVAWMAGWVA